MTDKLLACQHGSSGIHRELERNFTARNLFQGIGTLSSEIEDGWQVWLFGSEKDSEIAQSINQRCDSQCMNLAGKTTLDQTIDLMSLTDTVVTNDSGLMHIACALGKKVTAVFGSTSPDFTPPLSDQAIIVRKDMDCSPCFKRECPLGHMHCLTEITAAEVLSTVVR